MSELVITTKDDLEKLLKNILGQVINPKLTVIDDKSEQLNQRQAAKYCDVTEATLIRWKRLGKVKYYQLPGSSKIIYLKSDLNSSRIQNQGK